MKLNIIKNKDSILLKCDLCYKTHPIWKVTSNKYDPVDIFGKYCDRCLTKLTLKIEKYLHKLKGMD